MNLKKSITLGIIALFIGLAFTPMGSAKAETKTPTIPIELAIVQNDGVLQTHTVSLTHEQLVKLVDLLETLQTMKNKREVIDRITEILNCCHNKGGILDDLLNLDWLDKLPGKPIISCGRGRTLFTQYHARVQIKKLITTWHYPNGLGATIIWGHGLTAPPTQILLKRQIGFMVGFVGLYLYIPPLFEGMASKTCFIGSAMFAWGAAI